MKVLLVCLAVVATALASASNPVNLKDGFKRYSNDYLDGKLNPDLAAYFPREVLELAPIAKEYFFTRSNPNLKTNTTTAEIACDACIVGIDSLLTLFAEGLSLDVIAGVVKTACVAILGSRDVCKGAVDAYLPEIEYIALNSPILDGAHACPLLLGGQCGAWEDTYNWTIDFPEDVPKPAFEKPTPPKDGAKQSKVLHLSDIHLDLSYKIGTEVQCGLPLCCMDTTEMATDPARAAGNWGAYSCDTPHWTLKNMLEHIKATHFDDFAYIMLTGDYPAHDVWAQSRERNLEHARTVINMVREFFPDKVVVPSMGNHESYPCNSFPPSDINESQFEPNWLYSELLNMYGTWLPEEAQESFLNNGYYAYTMSPGFKVVGMNSNAYISYNFWMLYNYVDPYNHLRWLNDVLLEAEAAGEKVHIVSHAPPGDHQTVSGWGKQYQKVVDRFANTITAQFYGHTHNDQFIVWYDWETNSVPINVGFVSPSVTTYQRLNPSYRIYTLDGPYEGASMRVMNAETYIFDLDKANSEETAVPEYFMLYEHLKDLEMDNLFPEDFDKLARRLAADDEFYQKFYNYFNSDSIGDIYDKRRVVCTMLETSILDQRKCNEIMGEPEPDSQDE